MAEKIVIEAEVKSNIGDVSNEASSAAGNFKIMGISLNSVKAGFAKIIPMAKAMFGTIKAGMISTGIGALIVAFGVLMNWFSKTKVGAEALEKIFTGIGAVVSVIVDRISKVAVALGKLFSGDMMGGLKGVKGAFSGIGEEIANDVRLAVELKGKLQSLNDSERELNVEFAKRRAEIEGLKMISEDLTKTEEERLDASKKAFKIEGDLLDKRVANAETAVEIQRAQNGLSENMAEDLDALADKEIALANIKGESATKQIELNNKINSIEREAAATRKTEADERLAQIEEQKKVELERIAAVQKAEEAAEVLRADGKFERAKKFTDIQNENYLNELSDLQFQEEEKLRIERDAQVTSMGYRASSVEEREILDEQYRIKKNKLDKKAAKTEEAIEKSKVSMQVDMANQGLQILASAAGEGTALAKAAAIAQATISGVQGVQNAFTSANANIGATAGSFGVYPVTMAALAGTFAAMNIAKIASGGGGVTPPASPPPSTNIPAPQMMSGAFDISGGVAPEPLEAYVITDKMTSSQNQLANIRRRATI